MADVEEVAPRSIKDRIAALNASKAENQTPASPPPSYSQAITEKRKPPPPPLPRRPAEHRSNSTNNPPLVSNGVSSVGQTGNQPSAPETPATTVSNGANGTLRPGLPPRPSRSPVRGSNAPPALPARRDSEQQQTSRRPSVESVASTVSVRSTGSALSSRTSASTPGSRPRMLAPEYDPASLPPLPEKKQKDEPAANGHAKVPLRPARSASAVPSSVHRNSSPAPPALPGRPSLPARPSVQRQEEPTPAPIRARHEVKAPLLPPTRRSALDFGMNQSTETPPPVPSSRPGAGGAGSPPPVPLGSRPDLAALQASKPKMNGAANGVANGPSGAGCLICRDFSGPDNHAARFPRESIPSQDLNWLSHELTAPFPSPTDKARAIFTWLHHNIKYDTAGFFSGNKGPQTPAGVMQSGLAVCAGYGALFSAMALPAGLEAVTVSGHGKGYGFKGLEPGAPLPKQDHNHAWNAVRIDGGEWKLIDCTWGAGHLDGATRQYVKKFSPIRFTQSNEDFGIDHFPTDDRYFFRTDGRKLSWEEYIMQDVGGKRTVCGKASDEYGIRPSSVHPMQQNIRINDPTAPGPTIRFQMEKMCRHWRGEVHGGGPDPLYILEVGGRDGRKADKIPLEHDGFFWWIDMPRAELGAPGMHVRICAITQFDGREGRGLSKEYFVSKNGRAGMSWSYIATWDLV